MTVSFLKKHTVLAQGASSAVFYIQEGTVKLSVVSKDGKEATIAILNPGDFFGEGCFAGQWRFFGNNRSGPRSTRESKTVGVSFSRDSAQSLRSSLSRSPGNHSGTRFEKRLRLLLHNIANRRSRCTLIGVFRNQKGDSGYKCTE
jgi:CRP-like cAMP-binding protein